ncbi:STAS domain-containing protein [Saccharopolyspora sp. MS10]|uniref:STAS domain-containing protein n=1 Tax=Saccharopolyspora sp. MS10 TaxID=3385973 RepID=UPI0039A3281D
MIAEQALGHRTGQATPLLLDVDQPAPDVIVVTVRGLVDSSTVGSLEDVLWPRLAAFDGTTVVDLTESEPLEVPGLQLLTQAYMRTQARGVGLRVVVATPEVRDGLRAAGLEVLLDIRPTVRDALNTGAGVPAPA